MSFLSRLFGQRQLSPESLAKVEATLAQLRADTRPCLQLKPTNEGASWLGGQPELPSSLDWPRRKGTPLGFMAQIDLAECAAAGGPDWLPRAGTLLFFYDHSYGGDSAEPGDKASVRVLYAAPGAPLAPTPLPPDLPKENRLKSYTVRFEPSVSSIDVDPYDIRLESFSKEEKRGFWERWEDPEGEDATPSHQIGGYPRTLQANLMEWECELMANGLSPDKKGAYDTPQAKALRPQAATWRLLLQLDSDERLGANWWDQGRLYFWVRESDARAGDFSQCRMTAQFY